jgi:pilus assembly protein CpaE
MTQPFTGLIVSKDADLVERIRPQIQPLVRELKAVDGLRPALDAYRKAPSDLLITHLAENPRAGLKFVRQIKQHFPETAVIAVANEKNPDLILAGLRVGVSDFLVLPTRKEEIRIAVQRALSNGKSPRSTAEIIALFSLKGGQGVTSLAVNLADQIQAIRDANVLLLDLNLYMGEVGAYLNSPPSYTPFDLLRDVERVDENLLFSSLNRHPRKFYVLTAPEEISDAEQITGDDVQRMLALLSEHFDYIVVDLPHTFSGQAMAAMDAADHLVLVTIQSITAVKAVQRTLELFKELNYDDKKVKILLNRYLKNSDLGIRELGDIFQRPIFAAVSNNYRVLNETANKHQVVSQAHGKSALNRDLQNLTRRLIGAQNGDSTDSRLKGLLRRIRRHETQ